MTEKATIILEALMNVSQVESSISRIQKELKGLNIPKDIAANLTDGFSKLGPLLKDYKKQLNNGFSTQKDVNSFNTLGKKINEVFSDIDSEIKKINSQDIRLNVDLSSIRNTQAELTKYTEELEKILNTTFDKISDSLQKKNFSLDFLKGTYVSNDVKKIGKELVEAFNTRDIEKYRLAYERLRKVLNQSSSNSKTKQNIAQQLGLGPDALKDAEKIEKKILDLLNILHISDISSGSFDRTKTKVESLQTTLDDLIQNAQTEGGKAFEGVESGVDKAKDSMKSLTDETSAYGQSVANAASEVKSLQQSTQYFFSLRNMINLLRRGIKEAVDTVKELDAAMTQTAVVTNYSVGDMWKRLPEYTKNANTLGASVKDMYESATLYYQQGLEGQEVMSIASETMKMARIGGLEAADATDKMTAALRGFNMELNETSAQRVNDVYSNLAAKTASDTEELGTAMQRTASIAASAGMSFEGTAAFLAQAIETTREPAENLGTAMKTIVARFTELKKNPLEIVEVDGEEVSYNKVDTALQSIGVSLKDTNGQFRALDEVFLDIAQRWDRLSQTQQRYIATTAAGSRQQSRFIAMMSNYERTVQLMDYANNSAGASNEQFGKTMESLEAKLNKLHNAWDQFLMGIANQSFIKGVVDGLTDVFGVVNKVIDTLTKWDQTGFSKSILSLATAFMALKAGARGANSIIGGLGGLIDPKSSVKEGLKNGFFGNNSLPEKISNPIVKAIYSLIPHIDGSEASQNEGQKYGNFKGAKQDLAQLGLSTTGTYSLSGIQSIFEKNQINGEQQKAIFASSPGLKKSMTTSLAALLKESGSKPEIAKGLIAGFKKGNLTSKQVLVKGGLLTNFTEAAAGRAEEGGKEAARAFIRAQRKTISKEETQAIVAQGKAEGKTGKDLQNYVTNKLDEKLNQRGSTYAKNKKIDEALNAQQQLTTAEKAAEAFGKVGGALTSAGMSLQMFGSQLSTVNPVLGEIVSKLGGFLSVAGSIPNMISSIVAGGPAVWAITAAVTALGAAFVINQKQEQKVKDAAQAVTDSFKETNEQVESNISTLKQYQSQAATLAKGVDANGNNINLSDEEYSQYLEMVDRIATINPGIVQGYNAQGHAILDINDALKETLSLEEQRQKVAEEEYTSQGSLQKLLNARNIDKNYKGAITTVVAQKTGRWREDQGLGGTTRVKAAPMTDAVKATISQLQQQDWFDANQFKEQFDIDVNNLTDDMVRKFVNSQDTINSAMVSWAAAANDEFSESLTKSFSTLGEQTAAFDEAIQPALQALQTYATNLPGFENIGAEFRNSIMAGLKDIVIQPDLNARDMQEQARVLIQEFDNLTAEGGDYATAMASVEEAQNKFAQSLDASEYADGTKDALTTLNNLLQTYRDRTDAYSQSVADFLENQIARIQNFSTESGISLTQALNTATSEIAAAESAYDSFKEATKSDFSTAAESMKSIFDEITKETDGVKLHMQGKGDKTFWTGAESIFGAEAIADKTPQQIQKMLNRIEPMLQEGQAGFDAFWRDAFSDENYAKLKDIEGVAMDQENWTWSFDDNINPDVFKEMAEALGYSEEFLTSMLNKGKQFADIDFIDTDDVRKALSTDSAAIVGTDVNANGQRSMYVTEDYIRNAMSEANISLPEQGEALKRLEKEGIKIIPGADSIKKGDFEKLGISDLPSLIQILGDTGQFNKEEMAAYAEALQGKDFDTEVFAEQYQSYLENQEHPELQPLEGIENLVTQKK